MFFFFFAEYYKVKMLPFQREGTLSDVVAGGLTLSVMVLVSRPSWQTGHRMYPCPLLWVPSACPGEPETDTFPEDTNCSFLCPYLGQLNWIVDRNRCAVSIFEKTNKLGSRCSANEFYEHMQSFLGRNYQEFR